MKDKQIKKLVEAMERGDNKAFEKLYQETSKTVYFICLSFLGNEQDAQDIMQEVYITAFNKVSQLQDKDKFVPWINQIAVNSCKNQLVKNTPMPMDPEDFVSMPVEQGEIFLPEDYIVDKEKRKIIMDIMRSCLSEIQYKTVILFYFNGLTINEIADIMECPPGTVTYRLSVARAKLKQGILYYEGANDYRLHSFTGVPFLASILAAEAVGLQVPNIFPSIMNFLVNGATAGAGYAMSGVAGGATAGAVGTTAVKATAGLALKAKIAIAVAATVVVGGGVAVVIHNQDKEEPKEVIQYETIDPMSADELRDYFVEEYGFIHYSDRDSIAPEENEYHYKLEKFCEKGVLRIQLSSTLDTKEVKYLVIFYYSFEPTSESFEEYIAEYIDMSCFLCDNSEEKERLTELLLADEKVNEQIGNEEYKISGLCDEGEVSDYFFNVYNSDIKLYNERRMVITLDW